MGKIAEAYVDIRARMDQLDKDLNRARGDVTSFIGGANRSLAGLGVGLGAAGVGKFMLEAAKDAANLGEAMNKVKVVFGDATGGVTATVEDLANRFGVVKTEAFDAAANIGLIGQAAGMTDQASAKLASQFVRLANDAASFYNVPVDLALERIRSGLVGESEPMRAFGVLLNENAVKAEAMRLGLVRSASEMTEQTKVAARASLIMQGMAKVQGDMERTAGSAANQMRIFNGELANLKTEMGETFVGPLTVAVEKLRELTAGLKVAMQMGNPARYSASLYAWMLGIDAPGLNLQDAADKLAGIQKGVPRKKEPDANTQHLTRLVAEANGFAIAKALLVRKDAAGALADARIRLSETMAGPLGRLLERGWKSGAFQTLLATGGDVRALAPMLAGMVPEKKTKPLFQAMVTDAAGFQQLAQEAALNAKLDIDKKQLEEQKKANELHRDAKEALKEIVQKLAMPFVARVRGRE